MDAELMFVRGKDAADGGNYDYAIAIFLDILRLQPNHIGARIALRGCELEKFNEKSGGLGAKVAGFLAGLGPLLLMHVFAMKPAKVVDQCEKFLMHCPTYLPVLTKLAAACRKLGHMDAAVNTLEFARQRHPMKLKVLSTLAEMYAEQEDYHRAVRCWEEYLRHRPQDQDAVRRLKDVAAVSHLQSTGLETSDSFREQVRDTDKAAELEMEQHLVRSDDDIESTIADLQAKLQENPEDHVTLTRLGDMYARRQRYDFALASYEKAFEISERYQVREKIGDLKIRVLRNAEAAAAAALDAAPGNAQAEEKLRQARAKRMKFALEEYAFRVQSHPTDLALAFRYGEHLFEAGTALNDPDLTPKAIAQFQRAVSDPRRQVRSHFMLGRCFARDKHTRDMAVSQFKKARAGLETGYSDLAREIDYALAAQHELQGQTAEALELYKGIYEIDAKYRDVTEKIQKLSASEA